MASLDRGRTSGRCRPEVLRAGQQPHRFVGDCQNGATAPVRGYGHILGGCACCRAPASAPGRSSPAPTPTPPPTTTWPWPSVCLISRGLETLPARPSTCLPGRPCQNLCALQIRRERLRRCKFAETISARHERRSALTPLGRSMLMRRGSVLLIPLGAPKKSASSPNLVFTS
jgi:hypothetical protein